MADLIPTFQYSFGELHNFVTDHDEKFRHFLRRNYPNRKYVFSKNPPHRGTYLRNYRDYSLYESKISGMNVGSVVIIIYVTPKNDKKYSK